MALEPKHICIHEKKIILMSDHVGDMGVDLKLVLKLLRGNGEAGLITKMALQEQCIKKLHERLNDFERDIENMDKKVGSNSLDSESIGRLWKVLGLLAIPVIGACTKVLFFGG